MSFVDRWYRLSLIWMVTRVNKILLDNHRIWRWFSWKLTIEKLAKKAQSKLLDFNFYEDDCTHMTDSTIFAFNECELVGTSNLLPLDLRIRFYYWTVIDRIIIILRLLFWRKWLFGSTKATPSPELNTMKVNFRAVPIFKRIARIRLLKTHLDENWECSDGY